MADNEQVLTAILRLRDEFSQAINKPIAQLKKAETGFASFGKSLLQATTAIKGYFLALTYGAVHTADKLDKLRRQTGVSVEALQELAYIGEDVGASLDTIGIALRTLSRNALTAVRAGGEMERAFYDIGIRTTDLI